MSAPKSKEEELCQMFDSFSYSTISNIGKYMRRTHYNHVNRFPASDPQILETIENLADNYPSHTFLVFADELSCRLEHEFLYQAFNAMTINQRKVLILGFWHRWKDKQIARYLGVSVRTVYNLRQRAFKTILLYDEQRGQET